MFELGFGHIWVRLSGFVPRNTAGRSRRFDSNFRTGGSIVCGVVGFMVWGFGGVVLFRCFCKESAACGCEVSGIIV